MDDRSRIPPPGRAALDEQTTELLALAVTPNGQTAATIGLLAHNPQLVGPFLGWAAALHMDGLLSARQHELLALRVAHNCGSEFEWDEHRGWAREAGLTDEDINNVAEGTCDRTPEEAALLATADELHAGQFVSDQTLATLTEAIGTAAVVEAIMVVGQYTMLSMLASTAGLVVPRAGHS